MPFFDYTAVNSGQKQIQGVVEGPTIDVAMSTLVDKGLLVVSLKPREEKKGFASEIGIFNRVKAKDIVVFSRQLAVMVSATLPVVQALRILTKQISNVTLKIIVSEIADAVDGGARLSDAFGRYPKAFSHFYVSMIRSGETAGKLDEVLNYLADQQEKDYDLMSKTRGAMIYPAFILFGLTLVGIIMMVYVIPKLTEILKEAGSELPLSTRLLIGSSDFLSSWWGFLLLAAVLGAGIAAGYWRRTEAGRKQTDYLVLKAPIFGPKILQKIFLVRFTRSLSTLLSGGVALTEALKITSDVVGNEVYRDIITRTVKEVEDGNSIATVFEGSPVIPVMVSQMLSVGEQTGRIDTVLVRLADFYAREVDNAVTNLVTLIEPLILMLMGVAVAIMVAAILLPMYNMASGM